MRAQFYGRLTTACVIVALGSAIAFDIVEAHQWVIGLVGVGAGAVSLGSYLYRHGYFGGRNFETVDPRESRISEAAEHAEDNQLVPMSDHILERDTDVISAAAGAWGALRQPPDTSVEIRPALTEYNAVLEALAKQWIPRHERESSDFLSEFLQTKVKSSWQRDEDKLRRYLRREFLTQERNVEPPPLDTVVITINVDGTVDISSKPKYAAKRSDWPQEPEAAEPSREGAAVVH